MCLTSVPQDYFGEKIAFYFGWLGHYTTWLIYAAVAGVITFIANIAEGTVDSSLVPVFATFIAIWSTLFLEVRAAARGRHGTGGCLPACPPPTRRRTRRGSASSPLT